MKMASRNSNSSVPVLLNCRMRTQVQVEGGILSTEATTGGERRLSSEVNGNLGTASDRVKLHKDTCNYNGEFVVQIHRLCKSYEEGRPVLNNLCMNVRKGTIYGLLGSSGCGKTSLLSCVVGLMKWDSGDIFLFNKKPNGPPGRKVGFMPQDIALYDQLSIREMIGYYGLLYGMSKKEVEKQWLWLVEFLQLPSKFKLIKDLSGGQKRRVSLSISLIHKPELLILDEPTVGLDPMLRESIWEYLLKMVQTQKTTVIVTTHYIEETKRSNTIGFLRNGRILVEDAPETLLQQYDCNLLEQVVLKLCYKDEHPGRKKEDTSFNNNISVVVQRKGKSSNGKSSPKNSYNIYETFQENWRLSDYRRSSNRMDDSSLVGVHAGSNLFDRVRAMATVIWLVFWRHPIFMVMVLFLPSLQMLLTLAVLGTQPKDLKFGVVNHDVENDVCFRNKTVESKLTEDLLNLTSTCSFEALSCSLVEELSQSETFSLVPMQSNEIAHDHVHKGDIWGYFYFPSNYSKYIQDFAIARQFAENDTIEGSRVRLTMDMSHYLGASLAIRESFMMYEKFAGKLALKCGLDPREFQLPLMYRKPVYGKNDGSYQEYVIPIIVLTVIFEIPMLVTSIIFINDRKQGTFDRARVAGLHFKEVMISHFITQGSVIIGQTAICFVVMIFTYNFHVEGPLWLYFTFCILAGLNGESLGLLLGVIFQEEVYAVAFGILLGPILLTWEGALWPVEGMMEPIRSITIASPTTLMMASARSIIYKGVGILHDDVWIGLLVTSGWIIAFWVVSITIFIRKHR